MPPSWFNALDGHKQTLKTGPCYLAPDTRWHNAHEYACIQWLSLFSSAISVTLLKGWLEYGAWETGIHTYGSCLTKVSARETVEDGSRNFCDVWKQLASQERQNKVRRRDTSHTGCLLRQTSVKVIKEYVAKQECSKRCWFHHYILVQQVLRSFQEDKSGHAILWCNLVWLSVHLSIDLLYKLKCII